MQFERSFAQESVLCTATLKVTVSDDRPGFDAHLFDHLTMFPVVGLQALLNELDKDGSYHRADGVTATCSLSFGDQNEHASVGLQIEVQGSSELTEDDLLQAASGMVRHTVTAMIAALEQELGPEPDVDGFINALKAIVERDEKLPDEATMNELRERFHMEYVDIDLQVIKVDVETLKTGEHRRFGPFSPN